MMGASLVWYVNGEEEEESELKVNITVLTVTALVGVSLAFETGKEHLLERTSESMLPVIKSLFGELTLLGFIGVSLYLIFQMPWVASLSNELYGNPSELDKVGEVVHMVLFMVMVLFLMQALAMVRMGEATQRMWREWETRHCGRVSRRTRKTARRFLDASHTELLMRAWYPKRLRSLLFAATRLQFLTGNGLHETEFDFANYLSIALGHSFAEIVEVPVKTWLGLEVCLIIFYFLDSSRYTFSLWILLGYCILAMAFVVHAKLRHVIRFHIKDAVEMAITSKHDTDALRHLRILRRTSSTRGNHVANYATSPIRRFRRRSSRGEVDDEAEDKDEVPPLPVVGEEKRSDFEMMSYGTASNRRQLAPMLSMEEGRDSYERSDSSYSRTTNSPYEDSWRGHGFLFAVGTAQRVGGWTARVIDFLDSTYDKCRRCCGPGGGEGSTLEHRHWLRDAIVGDPDSEVDVYATYFWFGVTHKAEFTLDLIRTIPLFMSIYIAVFALVYAPRLYNPDATFFQHVQDILLVTLSVIPPVALQLKLPYVVEDFTVAANVEAFKNLRFVEQVLSKQKTVAAFQALRVVACLQRPGLVAKIMAENGKIVDPGCEIVDRHKNSLKNVASEEHEDELLEILEATEGVERRSRRSWANIFQLFDDDHEGSIDRQEMRAMLTKFSISDDRSDETAGQIDEIISLLDADQSGEISFEEFYQFGKMLEHHFFVVGDPKQLVDDMFHMIDTDRSGEIKVEELHDTMKHIGLDLSVDVVYNMMRDIDEDGNGALDMHEFRILIDRIDADFLVDNPLQTL